MNARDVTNSRDLVVARGEGVCETSYGDKRGKYQDQKGLTLPFVLGQEPPAEEAKP